jgi:hypothetical protein
MVPQAESAHLDAVPINCDSAADPIHLFVVRRERLTFMRFGMRAAAGGEKGGSDRLDLKIQADGVILVGSNDDARLHVRERCL